MSSIHTLIDLFTAAPTLTNAKKVVAKITHHPMSACLVLADGHAQIEKAKALVESEGRHKAMDVFKNGYHAEDAASMQRWLARR
jgi:hypothetical protein